MAGRLGWEQGKTGEVARRGIRGSIGRRRLRCPFRSCVAATRELLRTCHASAQGTIDPKPAAG